MNDIAIIELRRQGLSCKATAAQLGISIYMVFRCMRINHLTGKYRIAGKNKKIHTAKFKHKQAFSIMPLGCENKIGFKVLPTSERQYDELLVLLQKEGGEVI